MLQSRLLSLLAACGGSGHILARVQFCTLVLKILNMGQNRQDTCDSRGGVTVESDDAIVS